MRTVMAVCAVLFLTLLASIPARAAFDTSSFNHDNIIEKDVVILGGGASGTYAAVRLREDYNVSVVVVEPKNRLGGHVDTYFVSGTNISIDYGVQSYIDYEGAKAFFTRMGVKIAGPYSPRRSTTINVDLESGKVSAYVPPSTNVTGKALDNWTNFTEKYEKQFNPGLWDFFQADAIPGELLLPFGDFAPKYGVAALAPTIATISNIGLGGLKELLTMHMILAFGAEISKGLQGNTFFVPEQSNMLLYQKALALLQDDVLLSSRVQRGKRTDDGIHLSILSDNGTQTLVKAKKLLISAQPSLQNLQPFEIDDEEVAVFSTWTSTWSFVGVAKIPCIPTNYSLSFTPAAAVPDHYLDVRDSPYTVRFDADGPAGSPYFRVLFGANYSVSYEEAKATIGQSLQRAVDAGSLNYTGKCDIEYLAFADHNTILLQQTAEQIRDGFVQKLYALQGRRSTWYTGALWTTHYSSDVWAFTDTVIPELLKSLGR